MREPRRTRPIAIALATVLWLPLVACARTSAQHEQHGDHKQQQHAPGHHGDAGHHSGVDARGDKVMGFEHAKTTHHFLLKADGGVIDVAANDPADTASRDRIREHMAHIARVFKEGDFQMPLAIHDRVPPGADDMKRLKAAISYTYEETEHGGRVHMRTGDPVALDAIHRFLRFQIEDHRTGDPLEVSE